jgi:hypothetical protein
VTKAFLLPTAALCLLAGLFAGRAAPAAAADPVLVAAGDIAYCSNDNDQATAVLLDNIAGTVVTLGDNAYDLGTTMQFTDCYGPTWGRHIARTKPAPGNHDYLTAGAAGYYGYFGAAAGDPAKGYYSYDLGAWHIVVINSNNDCTIIACSAGSAQEQWLRADLAANPRTCTLAYWHHPRFSSGTTHGNDAALQPIWQALYDYGADVVLNGHEHNYERFALQGPAGVADPRGIREFVVGTGGRSQYGFASTPVANSQVRDSATYGVLKLTLHAASYDWQFIPVADATFTDSGTGTCVNAASVGGLATLPHVSTRGSNWTALIGLSIVASAAAALALGLGARFARRRSRPSA